MPVRPTVPSVYTYLDFREYLGDYYKTQKKIARGFSYRSFARRAGLSAPNHLQLIIQGKRTLTDALVGGYVKALHLEKPEEAYFRALVTFNQAKTMAERTDAYRRLRSHKGYRTIQHLDQRHAAYYEKWYIPAIRELATSKEFRANAEWIASKMVPAITVDQARDALDVLFDLGLLKRAKGNKVIATDWSLVTEDATKGVHLAAYHTAMLERAKDSIDLLPSDLRNLSAVTLCLGKKNYQQLLELVRRFRQDVIALANARGDDLRVVHVGLQAFVLTEALGSTK